jgi:cell division protein FtsL
VSDKHEILDAVDTIIAPSVHMGWRYLVVFLLIIAIALMLLFPKIYLQSQIYYKSRDIAVMKREYNALKEENHIIKSKVEAIKFKNQVLDTLF